MFSFLVVLDGFVFSVR